ncbi:hypothetical protein A1O7_06401 [Cladophialophora yegresii CBS 114405]|uniref:Uncharacterized protein n=1 Tax=Cladophialophora yegresii CBS 114405 TaxID=1182544 RepID=W9W1V9_9EURO|nr:uncharacterized protein A1O7_06401 [Cladophialophora yegresii CBS 114405]EXJ58970.1 hypothetical protein A1O7_06401 [Cladophialophora yegresii CBS 114405]
MATEAPPNYIRVSTRDEEDTDLPSHAHVHEPDGDIPTSVTQAADVPSTAISPPPSPPTRAQTEVSSISAVAQPRSNTEPLPQSQARPTEQLRDGKRHSSLGALKHRLQSSFDPSLHELLEKRGLDPSSQRQYSQKRQRQRLWRLTIGEFLYTVALCLAYFGVLYAYGGKDAISVRERRIFNALVTGVTLLLGVNLAASLRSYAKLLRWRILAICYRPLETFDLVMGCDSLMNVTKLLWKAGNNRYKYLPSRTQIICFAWLLVHVAITVLVGIIGLNYNLEDSDSTLFVRTGNISMVDLNALSDGFYGYDLAQVQAWGSRGVTIEPSVITAESESALGYLSDSAGYTLYYFQDQKADDPNQNVVSSRWIESQAYCTGYIVKEGQYGDLSYIIYHDGEHDVNQTMPSLAGPAGLIVMSKLNSTCGDRCVDMQAFQAATLPGENDMGYTIPEGSFFVCSNTVPQVGDDRNSHLSDDFLIYDDVGRMLAGSLGWSEVPPVFNGTAEYAVYTNWSQVSFGHQPTDTDMAARISTFTMGAIAFMDGSNLMSRRYAISDEMPYAAQVLKVKWKYAGSILGVIPFIHFLTLAQVILWANNAIIKDDSHLAIAKVYHSFLSRLGDHGCLLRGDEIVALLENPSVAYGWRQSVEPGGQGLMHVDVFDREHGLVREERPFQEGWYNGGGEGSPITEKSEAQCNLRRRYRDFDAAEFF